MAAPELRDVVVVGGGPAGAMAARLLASRGRDVLLIEEHADVGTPVHCTGLMGVDAFAEFGLSRQAILGEAPPARFHGAAGRSVSARSDRVRAVIIDRARFDRDLAASAARAGAEIRCGWRADGVAIERDGVRVVAGAGAGTVRARALVLACGARYRFHRALGLGLPRVFLQSAQIETPFPAGPDIEVRFGRRVAPGGFAWMVPVTRDARPHARIGLMSETHVGRRFAALASSFCAAAGVDRAAIGPPRLKMLPLGPVARTYADRVVAVGDAAGLVKPTTGGGIRYSLLSAALAAEVLDEALAGNRLAAPALARYERRWRQRLGREIRVGLAFRRIAARLPDRSIDDLIELARVDGVVPLLQQTASFDWHRKAAVALLAHPAVRRIVSASGTWRDAAP